MKKLITLLTFFILLSSGILAEDTGAPHPYPIYGIVTLDGVKAEAMSVSLTNTNTGESHPLLTKFGEHVWDGSQFKQGYSSSHIFKLTYCISDSRCAEESITFSLTGGEKNLGTKNIPLQAKGLSGPYDVYGKLTKDGKILDDKKVLIENINKGYSTEIKTNEAGEYVLNLANLGTYDTGDQIKVSYDGHSVIGYVSGAGLSLSLTITTSTPPGDNGGGGHSHDDDEEVPPVVTPPDVVVPGDDVTPDVPDDKEDRDQGVIEPVSEWNWILIIITLIIIILLIYFGYKQFKKK